MSESLLLDTHIALWLDEGNRKLRQPTVALIERCRQDGASILFSSVSAWEIAVLLHGGRLQLHLPADRWVAEFLDQAGVDAAPLSVHAASRAYQLRDFPQRDPADRLLIATAIELACPLITYDRHILEFARKFGPEYGFSARS